MNIILVGFKGSGKTTVGSALAKILSAEFVDLDRRIEKVYKAIYADKELLSVRCIYERCGIEKFIQLEEIALISLLLTRNTVIATGGGIVVSERNRQLLKSIGMCVFLDVSLNLLKIRIGHNISSPIFRKDSIEELHAKRYHLYMQIADIVVNINHWMSVNDVAFLIKSGIEGNKNGK